jgi:hypothetical protein
MQTVAIAAVFTALVALKAGYFCIAAPTTEPPVGAGEWRTLAEDALTEGQAGTDKIDGPADAPSAHSSEMSSSATHSLVSWQIYSSATGQYLAITKSGRVSANNPRERLVTEFYASYSLQYGREHVSLMSVKYGYLGWYLTINSRGKFRGGTPVDMNEMFEVVPLHEGFVALKVAFPPNTTRSQHNTSTTPATTVRLDRNDTLPSSSGSGSGFGSGTVPESEGENGQSSMPREPSNHVVPPQTVDCFLGFSIGSGKPACYESVDQIEVHLLFDDAIANS